MLRRLAPQLQRAGAQAFSARAAWRGCQSSSSPSSVDDALRAALARVAQRVGEEDPAASVVGGDLDGVPGVRTQGPKMLLRFTCAHEKCEDAPTITRVISKRSYEEGVVLVRCPSCDRQHLIADHLGWFGERSTIEDIMHEKGEEVQRVVDEGLLHVDPQQGL
jgi:protein import protein ZIM17